MLFFDFFIFPTIHFFFIQNIVYIVNYYTILKQSIIYICIFILLLILYLYIFFFLSLNRFFNITLLEEQHQQIKTQTPMFIECAFLQKMTQMQNLDSGTL